LFIILVLWGFGTIFNIPKYKRISPVLPGYDKARLLITGWSYGEKTQAKLGASRLLSPV